MAHVEFIDQTLRDGQQSLLGHADARLPGDAGAAAPRPHRLPRRRPHRRRAASRSMLRDLRRRPLGERSTTWSPACRRSHPRPGRARSRSAASASPPTRSSTSGSRRWSSTGSSSFWIFDCLYDMPTMKRLAEVIQRGRRRGRAGDHVRAHRPPHRRVLRRPRRARWRPGRGSTRSTSRTRRACSRRSGPRRCCRRCRRRRRDVPARAALPQHHRPGPLVYIEGLKAGIDDPPHLLAAAGQRALAALDRGDGRDRRGLGHTHALDKSQLPPVAEHFDARSASGWAGALGVPQRVPAAALPPPAARRHDRHAEEPARRARDAGALPRGARRDRPWSATSSASRSWRRRSRSSSASRRCSTSSPANATRSSPTRCIHYALGHYGPLMRPVDPDVADKILSQPRVSRVRTTGSAPHPTLAEIPRAPRQGLSDEELLLRFMCPDEEVDSDAGQGPDPHRSPPLVQRRRPPPAGPDRREAVGDVPAPRPAGPRGPARTEEPMTEFELPAASVPALIAARADGHGDRTFVTFEGSPAPTRSWTSARRRRGLAGGRGRRRRATGSPSCCATRWSSSTPGWGIARAGAVSVPINTALVGDAPRLHARALRRGRDHRRRRPARDRRRAPGPPPALAAGGGSSRAGGPSRSPRRSAPRRRAGARRGPGRARPMSIVYTSGTTGMPKGVVLPIRASPTPAPTSPTTCG